MIQKGRDILLKIEQNNDGIFTTVGGMRSRRIALNAGMVDVTHADSPEGWRELLGGAGLRSASLTGSGIFCDSESDAIVRNIFFLGLPKKWRLCLPKKGEIEGIFQITALEYSGDHLGEIAYEISLESAGILTFKQGER